MAYFASESLSLTTASDGSATSYTTDSYNGELRAIVYTPGASPWSNNVVITVTGETSGVSIWAETLATASAATTRYPRAATHSTVGVATLYAAGGAAVLDRIALVGERIKVVLSSGGSTKTSALRFIVGG